MVVPRRFEIATALGYAFATDESDYSSLFADVYFNYLARPFMIGAGVVLGSILLGWLLPLMRFRRRSRSSWSDI